MSWCRSGLSIRQNNLKSRSLWQRLPTRRNPHLEVIQRPQYLILIPELDARSKPHNPLPDLRSKLPDIFIVKVHRWAMAKARVPRDEEMLDLRVRVRAEDVSDVLESRGVDAHHEAGALPEMPQVLLVEAVDESVLDVEEAELLC